ncbi:Ig-like domain-containing protein [Streptomyces sp. NPDC057638]|uniref:L,D-transpeptidase n=1 Tax=Streptomyces sp. NPDC057638 TaxID=3346190 RepID=UPI0036C30A8A
MNQTPRLSTVLRCTLLALTLGAVVTACGDSAPAPLTSKPFDAAGQVSFNTPRGAVKVNPDKPLEVTVKEGEGRITDVAVIDEQGHHLGGELNADGSLWRSGGSLSAGARYRARVATENKDGAPGLRTLTFETSPAKRLLTVEFAPANGETYGVGQPIIAELSRPVPDKAGRAAVERGLKVDVKPGAEGAWHWLNDDVLHYRPKEYWPVQSKISVTSNLQGVKISNQLYGGPSEPLTFNVGDRMEAVTDASSHIMTVFRNGEEINNIPITTGKPGFATRNGIKVVLGKEYFVRMRGSSVGIGGSEAYDLPVYYATRVTWSGEYVHAAPWSIGSHGYANVSHGCTGMSTGNAAWFYETFRQGDLVHVVNSIGDEMDPFGNGYGDWNLSWEEWREGSALTQGVRDGSHITDSARLRPQI